MKRAKGTKKAAEPAQPAPAADPPGTTAVEPRPAHPTDATGWIECLMLFGAFAMVCALLYLLYALRSLAAVYARGGGADDFINSLKRNLADRGLRHENLQLFDRLSHLLANKTMHDQVAAAIANTSFLEFIETNIINLSADCDAPAQDLIRHSVGFLVGYAAAENVSKCWTSAPVRILASCRQAKAAAFDLIEKDTAHVGEQCGAAHVAAILDWRPPEKDLAALTVVLEFVGKVGVAPEHEGRVCEVAQAVTELIDDWEQGTRGHVCAVAEKIACAAFDAIDAQNLCRKSDPEPEPTE
jgi:hypothetical protein